VEGQGHLVVYAKEVQLALATLESLGVEMLHLAGEGQICYGQDDLDNLPRREVLKSHADHVGRAKLAHLDIGPGL
jgi:hypothetical protein